MVQKIKSFFSVRPDPITGDPQRFPERFSRFMQSIIRRWLFVGTFSLLTVLWWSHPQWFRDPALYHWNLLASYLAILIESAVGIGMFYQTMRDAVILRRLAGSEQKLIEMDMKILAILEHHGIGSNDDEK